MSLIDELIKEGFLKNPEIIKAFRKIKREDFLPDGLKDEAEENYPLSIGFSQTISQPLTVAFMFEKLQPEEGDKILDIGSGSGWTTALFSEIVGSQGKVFGIERIEELKEFGENNTKKYNFVASGRAIFVIGDGSKGLISQAPFDKIHVAAAAAKIPEELKAQLIIGGKMIIPVGIGVQDIVLVTRIGPNQYKEEKFPGFTFVPLVEKGG